MHRSLPPDPVDAPVPYRAADPGYEALASEQERLDAFRAALFKKTPHAVFTVLLLIANLAVFGAMIAKGVSPFTPSPDELIAWGANFAPKTFAGEEWRLGAYMFLHYGVIHLGMNMLALWSLGQLTERLFGNIGFGLLYLFSGLAGGIASAAANEMAVSAGASGAIFGVAGAMLGGCFKLRKTMPRPYLRAARGLGINILVLFAIFTIVNRVQPMIDNTAHLAGFLVGIVCGAILAEPIPHPSRSKMWLRNLIVAGLGSAGCFLALEMQPEAPADVDALLTRFQSVEKRSLRRWDALDGQYRQGAISEEVYADELESQVLPGWLELRQTFEEAENVPEIHQEQIEELLDFIKERETRLRGEIELLRESAWTRMEARYQSVEKRAVRRLQQIRERRAAGAITEEEYAEEIQSKVLPGWKELRQAFADAEHVPRKFQDRKARLEKIIELREAGWKAEIEAIQTNDPAKHEESQKLLNEASQLIKELNELPDDD